MQSHETFIAQVADLARVRLDARDAAKLAAVKLVYGAGPSPFTRGVTYFGRWASGTETAPFVEVCAGAEQHWLQVACTTLHELGHVLAGPGEGHSGVWKAACRTLGLRRALASGQSYQLAALAPDLRFAIASLARPEDGAPVASLSGLLVRPRPCTQGVGTRGGTSRGTGSGSRLVKVTCPDCGYLARVTRKWIDVAGTPICPVSGHGHLGEAD